MSTFNKKFTDWAGEQVKSFKEDRTWWVFCVNDPLDYDAPSKLHDLLEVWWQVEKGHTNKRPHLQGVAHFAFPKGRGQLQEYMPGWWQVMKGTPQQAIAYSTKEDTRIFGPWHHNVLAPFFSTLEAIMAKPLIDKGPVYTPFTGPLLPEEIRPWTECLTDKPFNLLRLKNPSN